jgi:hypothetical protein
MRGRIRASSIAAGTFALLATVALAAAPVPAGIPLASDQFATSMNLASSASDPFATGALISYGVVSATRGVSEPFSDLSLNGPPPPLEAGIETLAVSVPVSSDLTLDFGYRLDSAAPFNGLDLQAFDGLFLSNSTLGTDYTPFGNGRYAGATFRLTPALSFHAGQAVSELDRNEVNENAFAALSRPVDALLNFGERTAGTLMAGVTLKATDWGGIDVTESHASERSSFPGSAPASALSSDALTLSAELKFGSGWVTTASYGESLTKLDIRPSALGFSSSGQLHAGGYALSIVKHGIFGDDALGLSVSRPTDPEAASAAFGSAAPLPVFISTDHLLGDQKPETDIELGYTTSFSDSFALQTNAAYEINFAGQPRLNAVQLLSRAKIKF